MKYNPFTVFQTNQPIKGTSAQTSAAIEERSPGFLTILSYLFVCLFMFGCAANPAPDATGPRTSESAYPGILVDDDGDRRQTALAAWASFTRAQGINNAPVPDLQPVTATIRSIPELSQSTLHLPKIGDNSPMSEEETRESLRRFISYAGPLLCGDPQQLSLIQRVDGADGVKEALYQQRPFRYVLRGGYGELRIAFTSDRRIARMSSTCIPEAERIRRSFVGLGQQRISADKAIASLKGRAVSLTGADGVPQTYTVTDKDKVNTQQLVTYPILRTGEPATIEFHVAWEIIVEGAPDITVYVDSITGDILGAERGQPS